MNGGPTQLQYIRIYAMDSAYITEKKPEETDRTYKNRIYNSMCLLGKIEMDKPVMRITSKWPNTNWDIVWENLHKAPVATTLKVT